MKHFLVDEEVATLENLGIDLDGADVDFRDDDDIENKLEFGFESYEDAEKCLISVAKNEPDRNCAVYSYLDNGLEYYSYIENGEVFRRKVELRNPDLCGLGLSELVQEGDYCVSIFDAKDSESRSRIGYLQEASEDDRDKIQLNFDSSVGEHFGIKISKAKYCVFLEHNGKVVGVCKFTLSVIDPFFPVGGTDIDYFDYVSAKLITEIDSVYILPEFRGRGLSKKLEAAVVDVVSRLCCDELGEENFEERGSVNLHVQSEVYSDSGRLFVENLHDSLFESVSSARVSFAKGVHCNIED